MNEYPIDIQDYGIDELLNIMSSEEISQIDNLNAHSRLFVYNEYVYKLYEIHHKQTAYELNNLKMVLKYKKEFGERIVSPDLFIRYNSRIVGYRMKYIPGITFSHYLQSRHDMRDINRVFINLSETLSMLGKHICVCDLHAGNVIWDGKTTYLIDPDGYSVCGRNRFFTPFQEMNSAPRRFYNSNGSIQVGKNTDYVCMLNMYVSYLLEDLILYKMSPLVLKLYVKYLSSISTCLPISNAIKAIDKYDVMYKWDDLAIVSEEDQKAASYAMFCNTKEYISLKEATYGY